MRISVNTPALVAGAALFAATLGAQTDWPTYGHDEFSTHHSPLKQIDTKNVSKLERTWTYHMLDLSAPVGVAPPPPAVPGAPAGGGRGRGGRGAAGAADQGDDAPAPAAAAGRGGRGAAAGASGGRGGGGAQGARSEATPIVADGVMYIPTPQRRVIAIIPETGQELWSYDLASTNAATRGVEYWPGDAQSPATVFFGTTDGRLVGLNAKTGKPVPGFGVEGFVDIKAGYKGS
jgi:quinoprotein glucose dehydrogenase